MKKKKKLKKKRKEEKHKGNLKIIKHAYVWSKGKKTQAELPTLKRNKVLNTQDRANIKIISTCPRAIQPRFH